jgi:hypothetical protein
MAAIERNKVRNSCNKLQNKQGTQYQPINISTVFAAGPTCFARLLLRFKTLGVCPESETDVVKADTEPEVLIPFPSSLEVTNRSIGVETGDINSTVAAPKVGEGLGQSTRGLVLRPP